jgi:predicted nucleic acid-binding protein
LAKNRGIITQVQLVLDAMIDHAQYWVSQYLYEEALRQASELVE